MTRLTPPDDASATARGFGATISTTRRAGAGLYLVVGHRTSPEQAVKQAGGQVLVRFPDEPKLLAMIPLAAEQAVRRHPDVALAGAVTIDPARFAHFARMARLDATPDSEQHAVRDPDKELPTISPSRKPMGPGS